MSASVSELRLSGEVRDALAGRAPVVALESTIISHGLPRPRNLAVAEELERLVRAGGAVPATIAVIDGVARVGLDAAALERVATDEGMRKLGYRDLPAALGTGTGGGTTVSATAFLAARAGIRVFATGGLGGVHRDWTSSWDESADLDLLSRTRITVVCSGVKSILDVPATLQRLETLNVTVAGYRTGTFPGFYLHSSGEPIDWAVHSPRQVAAIMRDRVLAAALVAAESAQVTGQASTPFLLDYLVRHTGGAALEANLAAVRGNARLAAQIAASWAAGDTS